MTKDESIFWDELENWNPKNNLYTYMYKQNTNSCFEI